MKVLESKNFWRQFWVVAKMNWQRIVVYRMSVIGYRVGDVVWLIMMVLIWMAIYDSKAELFGYTLAEMITYLLVGAILTTFTQSYAQKRVSANIKKGKISIFLTKPMSFIRYTFFDRLGTMSFVATVSVLSLLIPLLV